MKLSNDRLWFKSSNSRLWPLFARKMFRNTPTSEFDEGAKLHGSNIWAFTFWPIYTVVAQLCFVWIMWGVLRLISVRVYSDRFQKRFKLNFASVCFVLVHRDVRADIRGKFNICPENRVARLTENHSTFNWLSFWILAAFYKNATSRCGKSGRWL